MYSHYENWETLEILSFPLGDCSYSPAYHQKHCKKQKGKERIKNIVESKRSLEKALREIQRPENLKEGVPALVRASGYSRPQLSRLIKKYRGVTPHEYVLSVRLDHAYQALILSDSAIDEISERIGFSSVSHFYKAFKNRFGIAPYALRKKMLEEHSQIIF